MDNPRGHQVIKLSVAVGVIDTIAVGLRFLARRTSKARWASDDWLIAFSLLPLYGMITTSTLLVEKGKLGRPIATLTSTETSTFLQILMSTMITYSLTITSVKISLLLLYRRVFTTPAFKLASCIVGILCLTWFFVEVFVNIFQCHPFNAAFDPVLLFTRHCINLQSYYTGITIANLVLDVTVLSLPIYMTWGLQLARNKKVMLSGIFALGGFSCIAGILRVVALGHLQGEDVTYNLTGEYAWSQIEPATAILCACVTTYRPLLTGLKFSKLSSVWSREKNSSSSDKDWTNMSNGRYAHVKWAMADDLPERDPLRGPSGATHVINIGIPPHSSTSQECSPLVQIDRYGHVLIRPRP